MALYHVLKTLRQDFAVAHIDHGWRLESKREAEELKEIVDVPFHLHTLKPENLSGNLEDACRNERLAFFKMLCEKHGYQAVLMGHQADDQAETVLKRLFEGAGLTMLHGIQEAACYQGMVIWRPMLSIPKKDILEYCESNGLKTVDDYTNRDERFLRARMRDTLLPQLAQTFGKEIAAPLAKLASDSVELKCYLDQKVDLLLEKMVEENGVCKLPLHHVHPIEIKHLLKRFLHSADQIEKAAQIISENKADKFIGPLYLHMGVIIYPANPCDHIQDLLRVS